MECEFCKKTFSTKPNLVAHQKTTKYCLEIQGKTNTLFKCEYCEKYFTCNQRLNEHVNNICKIKYKCNYEQEVKKLKEEMAVYKKQEKSRMKEKELFFEQQRKFFEKTIDDKNDYISKLEAKLEKFEDSILAKTDKKPEEEEEEKVSIPTPLKDQMSSIIIEDIKEDDTVNYSMITLNNVSITSRPIDHYVNATQLCQAGGKKFSHWFSLDTTKELINALESDAGIPASQLIETKKGQSSHFNQGSWIHPDLSISLAQWISPHFSIQVSKWIRTLFNKGSVEIDINLLREKERDMRIKDHLIKELKAVCLSKQRRVEYPEKNVIYLLTTEDHLKRRTYIVGKAKNLTTRLGTYNKTCDHNVVYYKECKGEEDMDTAENMVLSKLRDYREKANRDRFILPEDKEISFFIGIIDECIRFIG
jgi:KilA-N domain/Meiotically up-regulated gene 113